MTGIMVASSVTLALVALIELALSATWHRTYFTVGLPIFIRRAPVNAFRLTPLDTDALESVFSATFFSNSLVFKELDDCIYAFRDKLLEVHWYRRNSISLMHGILILDKTQQEVIVKGYANWVTIMLLPFFAVMGALFSNIFWWGIPISLVGAGIVYAFEVNRYGKVAEKAAMLAASSQRLASGEFD